MHQILKELRIEKCLTQKELAAKLGITQDSISLWEKGKRIPDTQYLTKLCEIFNVSADYLLGRSDDLGNVGVMPNAAPALSLEEQKLIQDYRGLSRPLKDVLQGLIKTWQSDAEGSEQRRWENR